MMLGTTLLHRHVSAKDVVADKVCPRFGGARYASGHDDLDIAKSVFQVRGIDAKTVW